MPKKIGIPYLVSNITIYSILSTPSPDSKRPALPSELIFQILFYRACWVLRSHLTAPAIFFPVFRWNKKVLATPVRFTAQSLKRFRQLVIRIHIKAYRERDSQGDPNASSGSGFLNLPSGHKHGWTAFVLGIEDARGKRTWSEEEPDDEQKTLWYSRVKPREPLSFKTCIDSRYGLLKELKDGDRIILGVRSLWSAWEHALEVQFEIWEDDDIILGQWFTEGDGI